MHWSGRGMNWNYMCADCHATAIRKGYDALADTFHTQYSELGVGCEGCHGPGAEHVRWGETPGWLRAITWRNNGLISRLDERRDTRWNVDSVTGNARRNVPRTTDREIDTCAQCHARRVHIADGYTAGAPLLDHYDVLPLLPSLYHPDGQQKDEVYNHGSFLQSRMHAFGVTCADCHDPHTQKLRRPGSQVCAQCHRPAKFDTTAHHGHPRRSTGSECAACHMPTTTYLEIDARHDHSIRVPRPDRSASMGVPNPCAGCHPTRDARWAAVEARRWSGRDPAGFQQFADAFAADDRSAADAATRLHALARDPGQPAIVRASALWRLARFPGVATREAAEAAASDANPLVRRAALEALEGEPPGDRVRIAAPLLGDTLRAIRQKAAWLLAAVGDSLPTPLLRSAFERAAGEFVASQVYNADRAEHRVTLGAFLFARRDTAAAEREFRAAIRQWPRHLPGYENLAGLLSLRGREGEGEALLREALRRMPDEAALHHALGLSLARQSRYAEASPELARAVQLSPADPAYARAYEAIQRRLAPR
jgi:predicted CXXCH cytochrome family protein